MLQLNKSERSVREKKLLTSHLRPNVTLFTLIFTIEREEKTIVSAYNSLVN